ncbi:multiple epidermal growth factor-like domains protein 10 isoform X7 [Biomphalaria pfeifferi]|uniref:Multiple epidermal growth factor-like domains protein 10 isoform X7 n=1 Tax=Biomphalaria pfeifferi TaxID=112525 RepID=A0AAD8FBK9_BIOPF|nr:multiple epidermal growth factor-like domains protein 10 isoform X7 [Biomphalaria pfeifferi]
MLMVLLFLALLEIDLVTGIGNQDCPEQWYGSACMQRCNCRNQKNCPVCNNQCSAGFFGRECQYSNTAEEENTTIGYHIVNKTFLNNRSPSSTLEIDFGLQTFFTWMEICFSKNETIDHESISLNFSTSPGENVRSAKSCGHVYKLVQKIPACVVLRCEHYLLVSKVLVYWKGFQNVVAVRVSGGVNVALKQRVLIGRRPDTNPGRQHLVLGVVDQKVNTSVTSYSQGGQELPYFIVVLREPVWIQRIVIESALFPVLNLKVRLFDEQNNARNTTYSFLGHSSKSKCYKHAFVSSRMTASRKVVILGVANDTSGSLTLTEIYIFSECRPHKFGPLCKGSCSIRCLDIACHVNGECFQCLPGMKGEHCLEKESKNGMKEDSVQARHRLAMLKEDLTHKSDKMMDRDLAVVFGGAFFLIVLLCMAYFITNAMFSTAVFSHTTDASQDSIQTIQTKSHPTVDHYVKKKNIIMSKSSFESNS